MKTFKRTLSLILTVCMIASIAVIATVTASANAGDPQRRPVVSECVNSQKQVPVLRYYFYMPETWRNEYNDSYDGISLDSCTAGIYWWDGKYLPADYLNGLDNPWPGYVIKDFETADKNIFYVDVPSDVPMLNFNNSVDGGADPNDPARPYAYQTFNVQSEYYDVDEDPYGFYPDGLEDFDNMIFVVDPDSESVNEVSGARQYGGDWFFYYKDGTYGIYPDKADAEANNAVLSKGEFPLVLKIDQRAATLYLNEPTQKSVVITPNFPTATATVDDESVATIVQDPVTGAVTVTAVSKGETFVDFTDVDTGFYRRATIDVTSYSPQVVSASAKKTTLKIGETTTLTYKVNYDDGKTKVTSDNTKVVTVSGKTIKAVGAGTANIVVKNGIRSKKVEITVKKLTNPMTVKFTKTVTANSKKNVTATVAKVSKQKGKVTYKVTGDKKVTIKNGKLTIKKGLKKGKTIKVKVSVTAAGDSKYAKLTKTQTVSIKVK